LIHFYKERIQAMSQDGEAAETSPPTESVEVCHRKVPKSVMIQIFQCLDKASLKIASEVSKSFNELSKHPSLKISTNYTGPKAHLPQLQAVIPYPPPAVLQTTLPSVTTVNPAPQFSTVLPESTKVILPVLPETVPLIAQVPDVVTTSIPAPSQNTDSVNQSGAKEIVQISQVLPGYAPSYAQEYVPNEVNNHSFSTFANTISFNVSRYPTLVEMTDSKEYEAEQRSINNEKLAAEDDKKETEDKSDKTKVYTTASDKNLEYVPAEYFRGAEEKNFIQTVSASGSIGFVKPDVLASGRILTHMTPIPSPSFANTNTTASTTSEIMNSLPVNSHQNGHLNGNQNSVQVITSDNGK